MAILVPSILSKDPEEIRGRLEFLETIPEVRAVQLDFADGKFVPNSLPAPREIGELETKLELEAHLMVMEPQRYLHDLEALGVKTAFIHYESFYTHEALQNTLENARQMGLLVGLAINPQTDIYIFDYFDQYVDEALLMGVNPGFQGQAFIPETLARAHNLEKKHGHVIIEVDGGVKLENVEAIVAHGADKVNVGSGIWQSPDPKATIYKFLEKLKK
ncbi:MAG: hypothetical protein HY398_02145 [Candidatus Doudnabacteria bacterium]|nr:hypothetical protein [Candidatus Doudnabacteria bacterium]